jgi:uncharacterized integral membrane protein (TIGR00697 family)
MYNELIFLVHSIIIGVFALCSLRIGKEALIAFIALQSILANLFVVKEITIFGLTATCADAFAIGAVLGLNLLQEYFGKEITKKTIGISFFLLIFYGIISQIHLAYTPSLHDSMQSSYAAILQFMPRLAIASMITYLIAQLFDAWLYGKLKEWINGRHLIIRNICSISLSQLLDTILFSFLGLYGIIHNVWHIIIISYAIKLVAIALSMPFVALSKRIVNKNMK